MVSVRIRGGDRIDFTAIESKLADSVSTLEEVKEYVPDPERFQDSWVFVPNLPALSQYNISSFELSQQIRGAFAPHLIQETRINGENIGVYSRVKLGRELDFSGLAQLEVVSPSGLGVPLSFLGSWKKEKTLKEIAHYDGMRNLTMDFSVAKGSNINAALAAAGKVVDQIGLDFPSYEISVRNANEQEVKSQAWALKVAVVCIAGVLLVIALVLGSLTQPFLVGLPIPFALVGIILALFVHGEPLGLMALVGLIGTVGVGVNASIVMVDQMNQNSKSSQSRLNRSSIIKGASSRFRAILLTTLTTLAGVFPMAYSLGGESGFTQPLAFALGWGITFSTLMTLFALPALLEIREDLFSVQGKILGLVFSSKIKTIDIEEQKAPLETEEKERIPEPWKKIPKDNDEKIGPRQ
jgi:multidrug efflux pump subunit AcrB